MNKTPNDQHKRQPEDKDFKAQLRKVREYLKTNIATASMVELATGVHHKNICRHKRTLEKAGLLWELYKTRCERTGFKAWYLTTNPDKAPNHSKQQSLF